MYSFGKPNARLVASTTCPMPVIGISTVHSTSCTLHYKIENPTGDTISHRMGDVKHKLHSACACANAKFGVLDKAVIELPGICPPYIVDIAVSCNKVPTTFWELAQEES